jgi:peptide deformylase
MAVRDIATYPHPELNEPAEPIISEFGSEWLKELVNDMEQTLKVRGGVGLAAVQIGVNKAVIIYEDRTGKICALCNPKVMRTFGKVLSKNEGCLSLPGFRADIRRAKGVKVKAQTIDGSSITVKERGFVATILQHEIDHINGVTLLDKLPNDHRLKRSYLNLLKSEEANRAF